MQAARHFKLDSNTLDGVRRFYSDHVDARTLAQGKRTAVVTVTRTGTFYDPRYGEFDITRPMLLSMVRNFEAGVFGQRVALDVAHNPGNGAAGYFTRLFLDGNKLRGEVELTDYGIESITQKGFIYLSAEFHENWQDNEDRKIHGPTLLGAALTTRPVIKRLDPVQLSEDGLGDAPTYLSDRVTNQIKNELEKTMEKFITTLRKRLAEKKLSQGIIDQLVAGFEKTGKTLADEDQQKALMESFIESGENLAKQLAEDGNEGKDPVINLSVNPAQGGMSEEQVKKLMADMRTQEAEERKKLEENRQANVDKFKKLLDEAEGLGDLSEDQRKKLDSSDLITAEMTEEQVTKLAQHQIDIGNAMVAQKKLADMAFEGQGPGGHVHIEVSHQNEIKSLAETYQKHLRETSAFHSGEIAVPEKDSPFITKVLAEFDKLNAPRLVNEHKMLAGGTTGVGDTNLPVGVQRAVIREVLANLDVLQLVNTMTDPQAQATTQIPYELRDVSAVYNQGVVYEGQPIHRASVQQKMDTAYIVARKLAYLLSNEVIHFSRASRIDWDALARNVATNSRYMRELLTIAILNTMQRAADSYLAASITDEDLDAQLDGATSTIKTAQFPIVRPHQNRDLEGNAIGSESNPITVKLNGSAISEYDGTGTQSAGTYYRVTSYNLGYVQFVDQTGSPVTPSSTASADTISYDYATNIVKFDTDNGSTDLDLHLNGLLRAIGGRKATMMSDRFVEPDFQLMSATLNDTCTNARQFEAQSKKNGTDTTSMGNLQMVKGIPAFSSDVPGSDLGDERILLGQRGTCAYTIAKPFMTGQPFEAVDSSTGKPTGQKQAYGEEYSAIKVPDPIRNRFTSVIAYSASNR